MAFHFSMSIHKAGFPPTLETGLPFYGYWPFSDWPSWKELYKRRARRTSGSGELLYRTGRVLGNYLTVISPPTTIYSDRILLTDLR